MIGQEVYPINYYYTETLVNTCSVLGLYSHFYYPEKLKIALLYDCPEQPHRRHTCKTNSHFTHTLVHKILSKYISIWLPLLFFMMEIPTAVNTLNQSHVSAYHKEMEKGKYLLMPLVCSCRLFIQPTIAAYRCCISRVCINVKVNWSCHSDLLLKSEGCGAVTFFLAVRTSVSLTWNKHAVMEVWKGPTSSRSGAN